MTLIKNQIYKLLILLLFTWMYGSGCCKKPEKVLWNHIIVDSQTLSLVDSVIDRHHNVNFKKDTCLGLEARSSSGFVAVQFCNVHKEHPLAFVSVQKSDTEEVEVFVFKVLRTGWIYQVNFRTDPNAIGKYEVELRDIDFDHKADLLIKIPVYASRVVYGVRCFAYDIQKGEVGVVKIKDLSSTDRIDCDEKFKTITCYTDGGNFEVHQKIVYKWNSDTLQVIKRLDQRLDYQAYQNLLDAEELDLLSPDSSYVGRDAIHLEEYILLDGRLQFSRNVATEDPVKYFEQWH